MSDEIDKFPVNFPVNGNL